MELKFYYPNKQPIPVKFAFTFRIITIDKEYIFYGLGEQADGKEAIYFGELVGNVMTPVNQFDLETFKKFIVALANNQITKDSIEYLQTVHNNLEVEVRGGQKTTISSSVLETYKKEPDIDALYGTPVVDTAPGVVEPVAQPVTEAVIPVSEPTVKAPVMEQPVAQVESTPVVQPTEEKEKKPKKKQTGMKVLIIVLVIILLGAGVYGGYLWIKANNEKSNSKPKPNEPETPIVETKTMACTKDSTVETDDIKQSQLIKLHFKDSKLILVEDSINSTYTDKTEYSLNKELPSDVLPTGMTQTKNCNDTSLTCSVTTNLDVEKLDAASKIQYKITDDFTYDQYLKQYTDNGFECK